MLGLASMLAAMTIAGAFWVGVLAARRLRDFGEGRRALEAHEHERRALPSAEEVVSDQAAARVRERVAHRLEARIDHQAPSRDANTMVLRPRNDDLDLSTLRVRDIVCVETGDPSIDGDHICEGLVHLREGLATTTLCVLSDAGAIHWLIGSPEQATWSFVREIRSHRLRGEPPRQIAHEGRLYDLVTRGEASVALIGQHGRPNLSRIATYEYRASADELLWLERWGQEIFMGQGRTIPSHAVSFLPAS